VLIVDDVVTTGATTTALASQLSLAGDVRISVFSLAIVKQHHR
jgi:predicted amidophosphoribosyltransferase